MCGKGAVKLSFARHFVVPSFTRMAITVAATARTEMTIRAFESQAITSIAMSFVTRAAHWTLALGGQNHILSTLAQLQRVVMLRLLASVSLNVTGGVVWHQHDGRHHAAMKENRCEKRPLLTPG